MHLSRSQAFLCHFNEEDSNLAKRRQNFSRKLDLLWSDYFDDRSRWWDIRKSKTSSSSPDFRHKVTKEPLWLHSRFNPFWVHEELLRLGVLPSQGGAFHSENESTKASTVYDCVDADGFKGEKEEDTFTDNNPRVLFDCCDDAISLLKDCALQKNLSKGFGIHLDLVGRRDWLESNAFLCNTLLNMYAECGALAEAQDVFDESAAQDAVLWSTLIGGYAKHGHGEKALFYFKEMQSGGFSPNAVTFVCVLQACASLTALDEGQRVHAQILKTNLLDKDVVVATMLVDMYAKCNSIEKSHRLFNEISVRNEVLWTALIAGYTQWEFSERALECYEQMQAEGFCPNAATFACVLKTCGSLGFLNKGQFIHAQLMREFSMAENAVIASALIDMYAKCGVIERAREVSDMLQVRVVNTWNALITGYTQHGHGEEALNCFKQMQLEGTMPDEITFLCVLKACGSLGAGEKGQDLHAQIVRERLLERSDGIASALVNMHAKCGTFQEAQKVFREVAVQSVVLWNALINGYVDYGRDEEAMECFEEMQHHGFSPDVATFTCILKACASKGASSKGQTLHTKIVAFGMSDDTAVGTALIDMYSNCGMLKEGKAVFDMLLVRDVVCYSALMVGFAQLGKDDIVFTLFEQMIGDGARPNAVTFSSVLCACSHRGLLGKGQMYLQVMIINFKVFPTSEHFNSMLDLFGRAGLLEQAVAVIEVMPFTADATIWHTFLSACSKWGHTKFGRQAFESAVQTDEKHPAPFVYMGNICVDSTM